MMWQKHTQSHRNDDEYTAMAANGMNCKQHQIKSNLTKQKDQYCHRSTWCIIQCRNI